MSATLPVIKDQVSQTQIQDPVGLAVKDMHITIVQDVSGSMEDQRKSVANGVNEIVREVQSRYREPCE